MFPLPRISASRLDFEKQKYLNEQKYRESEQTKREQERFKRQMNYQYCDDLATKEYWSFMELSETPSPNKKGVTSTPGWVRAEAEKKKQGSISECLARLGDSQQ